MAKLLPLFLAPVASQDVFLAQSSGDAPGAEAPAASCAGTSHYLPAEFSQPPGQLWTYPPLEGVHDPPPSDTIDFAGSVTDYAVLQKGADTSAAVYGTLPGATGDAKVIVTVDEEGEEPYTLSARVFMQRGTAYWKALLNPHAAQGGDITINAKCAEGCANTAAVATVRHLTYGDVWFCSGQSNMELGMDHALTRNRTYAFIDAEGEGKRYHNIRTHKQHKTKSMDGEEVWTMPPPAAPACKDHDGTPRCYFGWQVPNSSKVHEFSAACWFAAQELTDLAAEIHPDAPAPILGLIQSSWGGSQIEGWMKNDTMAECMYADGSGVVGPGGSHKTPGALWNGMVAPFINYTIFGVLWYQGENNVGECKYANDKHSPEDEQSGVHACGNSANGTGYACQQKSLVTGLRRQWSLEPGTTAPDFPFGIVSLHPGGSEGHTKAMAAFRHAQTASYGVLPGPEGSGMENTFVAMAYDVADPGERSRSYGKQGSQTGPRSRVDSPYQIGFDFPFPGRPGYTAGGAQRFTAQFMGGLHPRSKQTVGRRLALGAAAVAYGWDVVYTGPVLKNCSVLPAGRRCVPGSHDYDSCVNSLHYKYPGLAQRQITLNFDEKLLGMDAVQVWPTTPDTEGLAMVTMYNCLNGTCFSSCGTDSSCVERCATLRSPQCDGVAVAPLNSQRHAAADYMHFKSGRVISPLEVQLNGTIWMPASISLDVGGSDPLHRDSWTRVDGWSSVVAHVPVAIPIGCGQGFDSDGYPRPCPPAEELHPGQWCENCTAHFQPTGVRYAWAESPCCVATPGDTTPCPVNSCPISTYNSTLPAVPFSATLVWTNDTANGLGTCQCAPPAKCS